MSAERHFTLTPCGTLESTACIKTLVKFFANLTNKSGSSLVRIGIFTAHVAGSLLSLLVFGERADERVLGDTAGNKASVSVATSSKCSDVTIGDAAVPPLAGDADIGPLLTVVSTLHPDKAMFSVSGKSLRKSSMATSGLLRAQTFSSLINE